MASIASYETSKLVTNRKITSPGDYRFLKCKIGGVEYIDKIVSAVMFEDMTKPYTTGEILCLDTKNIPSALPIIGGEKIELSIKDCFGDIEDYEFYVTKVSDRHPVSLGSLSYNIHFSSGIGVLTSMRKISKAYQKMKTEDIISDIMTNYLSFPGETISVDWSDTQNQISCIIPNWRPAQALKWLASRAMSARTEHQYAPYVIFQERNKKFTYAPLDFFYDEASNVVKGEMSIKHSRPSPEGQMPSLLSDPRMPSHILAFEQFKVVKTTDFIENLSNGMYSNQVTQINLFARVLESQEYKCATNFNDSKHLNPYPFLRDGMIGADEPSKWISVAVHDGLFSDMDPSAYINPFVHYHTAKWQDTEQNIVQGVLPGQFGLRIGQKYFIKIPAFMSISQQTQQREDEYYSGNYIVSAIKHEFAADNHYYATCEMFCDSLSKKVEVIQ
jgi:hypothetical protein